VLPVDSTLPALLASLESHNAALLVAPPGAGKTTRVPLALIEADWAAGRKILMLEPRRLAARSAARFMAGQMGESVGRTVGYRTRLDSKVSSATRIEVVTEGILTRMIQSDPALEDVACVIFDEFHERSLHADLGLALALESQQALRPDLKLLVMSATLAIEPLKALLGDPPLLFSEGRSFPVEIHYRPARRERRLIDHVVSTIRQALTDGPGSILVFLPGVGEIRRVAERLADTLPSDVLLCPLYGDLAPAAQDAAIAPAPAGQRKVVLATAIAESSLTIEGIRVVIDAGLQRRGHFDPNSGMNRLVTESVSRASAEQRAGRAGRLEPGVCYRLWSEGEQPRLRPHTPAEILDADLAPLVLELAQWGISDPSELSWLDPPPPAHWSQGRELLQWLDGLDVAARITPHGRAMLELGLHPRLAHLVIRGGELDMSRMSAELAALLSDRDLLPPGSGSDLALRLQALRHADRGVPRGRLAQARKLARQIAQRARFDNDRDGHRDDNRHDKRHDKRAHEDPGLLLALAFPDRVAQARGGRGRFRLANGRGAWLAEDDALAGSDWLVAAELDGQAREARIFLAAAVDPAAIESALSGQIETREVVDWDDQRGRVAARRQRCLGRLVLDETLLEQPGSATLEAGLLGAVRRKGIASLPWTEATRQWQARVGRLNSIWPEDWPKVDDDTLLERLDDWLLPFLAGARRWADVEKLDLINALNSLLDYPQQQALAQLMPIRLEIPTGRSVAIDYMAEGGPVLASKLQSLFGWKTSPTVARGHIPIVVHLLSPAGRPLAVTADLASFWANAYPEVRKDMRGRYPKHPWPEDPLSARPLDGVKRRAT
jgi:ATP-dependent helicase HrpB